MCYVGPEVAADDAVPGRAVVLVELLLDVLRDVLLHGVLLERDAGDVEGLLAHLLLHVGALELDLVPRGGGGARRRGARGGRLAVDVGGGPQRRAAPAAPGQAPGGLVGHCG